MAMTPTPKVALITVVAMLAYLGLAILGWGSFAAFFSHSPLIALVVVGFALMGVALLSSGNLSPGEREDKGSRRVLGAFGVVGILLAYLPAYTDRKDFWPFDGDAVRWLGVVLFAAGGALRIWPVFVPGRRFSGLVAIQPGHTLVTRGIYGVIRHLSYLGFLVGSLGWALAFRSALGVLLTALLIPPLLARIGAEERLLRSQFGAEYDAYRSHTSRLIPGNLLAEACNEFGQILASRAAKCRSFRSLPCSRRYPMPRTCLLGHTCEASASVVEFDDVEAGVVVGAVEEAGGIDEHVGGLDDPRAIGPVIHHARGRRRHQCADFVRPVRITDIEGPHARILVGGKDQLRADEAPGPVLVKIVRTEVAALAHIVLFRRRGEGGNTDRICLCPVVEHPDELEPILLMIEHGFIEDDEQIAVRQRQAIVRAAAERRRPIAMGNALGPRAIGNVDHHHAGVAPGRVSGVAINDRVVQSVAAGGGP